MQPSPELRQAWQACLPNSETGAEFVTGCVPSGLVGQPRGLSAAAPPAVAGSPQPSLVSGPNTGTDTGQPLRHRPLEWPLRSHKRSRPQHRIAPHPAAAEFFSS